MGWGRPGSCTARTRAAPARSAGPGTSGPEVAGPRGLRARGRKAGTHPAPPAGGAAQRRLLPRARAARAQWRARCRRWQRWPSPESPAMAGAPGPLRLALLLLGAVGRAGPRPQVRPAGPGAGEAAAWAAAGAASGQRRPRLERNSATAGGGNPSLGEWDLESWVSEVGARTADASRSPGQAPPSWPPGPLCRATGCPAAAVR